jgi:hypothetical protein
MQSQQISNATGIEFNVPKDESTVMFLVCPDERSKGLGSLFQHVTVF